MYRYKYIGFNFFNPYSLNSKRGSYATPFYLQINNCLLLFYFEQIREFYTFNQVSSRTKRAWK